MGFDDVTFFNVCDFLYYDEKKKCKVPAYVGTVTNPELE